MDWYCLVGAKVRISSPALFWMLISVPAGSVPLRLISSEFWLEDCVGRLRHAGAAGRHQQAAAHVERRRS